MYDIIQKFLPICVILFGEQIVIWRWAMISGARHSEKVNLPSSLVARYHYALCELVVADRFQTVYIRYTMARRGGLYCCRPIQVSSFKTSSVFVESGRFAMSL